jgi:choline monooxygenase
MKKLDIAEDISRAATLPAWFYREESAFETVKTQVLARVWHYVADSEVIQHVGQVYPFTLLDGVLDEPLLFTRDQAGRGHCLSNVCTHRGKIVVESPGEMRRLTCGYHGRCFELDGSFRGMPAFKEVVDFPSAADNLAALPWAEWLGFLFVALEPAAPLEEMVRPIQERMSWLPLNTLRYDAATSKDYHVEANWALYCDNYLEGFHIPFVHPTLNDALDFTRYDYELYPYCNLQIGIADEGQPCFQPPPGHPDHGRPVYGYYFWLFPNLMFNFYPWGLSLNVVEPLSHRRTRIRFRTYFFAGVDYDREVNRIDQTELEDEAVVESVQLGLRSRYYHRGRFSPSMEKGVHHFHRLLASFL